MNLTSALGSSNGTLMAADVRNGISLLPTLFPKGESFSSVAPWRPPRVGFRAHFVFPSTHIFLRNISS